MKRGRRIGRLTCAVAAAAVAAGVIAAPASAGPDLFLGVYNHTQQGFKLYANGKAKCWFDRDINGTTQTQDYKTYTTEASVAPFDCFPSDRYRGIGLKFEQGAGNWQDPLVTGKAGPLDPTYQWELTYDVGPPGIYRMRGIPDGWFPANPLQSGSGLQGGAGGMWCIGKVKDDQIRTGGRALVMNVENEPGRCGSPREADWKPEFPIPAPRTGTGAERAQTDPPKPSGKTSGTVVALFDMARVACNMIKPGPRWPHDCGQNSDAKQWDLDNISADVRKAKPTNNVQPVIGKKLIFNDRFTNANAADATIENSIKYSHGYTHSKDHKFAFKFGQKLSGEVKFKIPIGEAGSKLELDTEEQWTDGETWETSDEVEATRKVGITAKAGGTTFLRVYQDTGNLTFNYTADLTYGEPNYAQSYLTPMTRSLGMSAARVHPCVGYLTGTGDPNSLLGIGSKLRAQGYSESNPGLPADQKSMLRALPHFTPIGNDRCPGWPEGYPAAMVFQGEAGAKISAQGPTDVPWAKLGDVHACTWFEPARGVKPDTAGPDVDPCLEGSNGRGLASAGGGPGSVVDGDRRPAAPKLRGTEGSNLIIADGDAARPEALIGGAGILDALEGAAGRQEIRGGEGEDIGSGAGGNDLLVGGPGFDTLDGGAGRDRLIDDAGRNDLDGGLGDDVLSAGGDARGGLAGGPGDDVLRLGPDAEVALIGDDGADTYRIASGADAAWAAELAFGGRDTIEAKGSVRVPRNVERAIALSDRGSALRSGSGDQTLIGGEGDDVLAGGIGTDRLNGRAGDDRLLIGDLAFDRATGGPGADDFMPIDTPATGPLPAGLSHLGAPSANLITDFSPAGGDRLLLTTATFGDKVVRLERKMVIRSGAGPEPRGRAPQLLFSRASSLLRFDSDGAGPMPSQVVAILEGVHRLPAGAIEVKAGGPVAGLP